MTDRIDPGPGWRLLDPKEIVKFGDERRLFGKWAPSLNAGMRQVCGFAYRRRIPTTTTKAIATTAKAIATRATVICATPDGARTESTISRKSGLTEYDCERIGRAWENMQASSAKYIMLEIQREGEP